MSVRYRAATLFLLLAALLTGCVSPTPVVDESPQPAVEATPDPEEEERKRLLHEAQDGFLWEDGSLYALDEEGRYLKDRYVGILYFGSDGKYTSGSEELDRLVEAVIAAETDPAMPRMEKLRSVYNYTRDSIRYVGFSNHDLSKEPAHGPDGWMTELAIKALSEGVGNCYHFAAVFTALARGLGYQAYAAGGVVGALSDPHGWVEIVDDDGNIWISDPEIEYRKYLWEMRSPDLFYRTEEEIGEITGLGYAEQVDPFAAERDQAK